METEPGETGGPRVRYPVDMRSGLSASPPGDATKPRAEYLKDVLERSAQGYDQDTACGDPSHVLERLARLEVMVGCLAWLLKQVLEELAKAEVRS